MVIIGIVGLSAATANLRNAAEKTATLYQQQMRVDDLQFRYLVGAGEIFKGLNQDIVAQAKDLKNGSFDKRLRFVILVGELKGPEAALRQLEELDLRTDEFPSTSEEQARVLRVRTDLFKLYKDNLEQRFTKPTEIDQELLRKELGWAADLAVHPSGGPDPAGRDALLTSARRTFVAVLIIFGAVVLFGLAGLAGFATVLLLAWFGKLASRLPEPSGTSGLYAETFALWMVLFAGLNVATLLVPVASLRIPLTMLAFPLSLSALAWPVLWGVPWRQVRDEIGLTVGSRPVIEVPLGVVTYLSALPLMVVGICVTFLLMRLQTYWRGSPGPSPAHPIDKMLEQAGPLELVLLFVLASILAPIIEETMFRGVLYRHVREATGRFGKVVSVLFSALLVSFIFAVIHPQGWLGVPVLMALAFAFSLAREWRGTLVPAMVAHGLNNGVALLLALILLNS
jgi:membrane protease YdiL (CAAX protease family)